MFEFDAVGRVAECRAIKAKDGSRVIAHSLKMAGDGYSYELSITEQQFKSLEGASHCHAVGVGQARYDGQFQMKATKVVPMTELSVLKRQIAKAEAAEKAAASAAPPKAA